MLSPLSKPPQYGRQAALLPLHKRKSRAIARGSSSIQPYDAHLKTASVFSGILPVSGWVLLSYWQNDLLLGSWREGRAKRNNDWGRGSEWGSPGAAPPTCLVRGDVDHSSAAGLWAQVGDTVDRLDPEGVVHVGQQVGHQQAGLCQAGLLWDEASSTPTSLTVAQGPGAAAAYCVVGDVAAATWVQRRGPLQGHRRSIYAGDQVHWC